MAEQKNPQAQPELSLSEQTRIRREKLTNLQAEGQNPFVITRFDWDATSQQIKDNFDAMEGKPVKVAGRLMSKRGMRFAGPGRPHPALRPSGRDGRRGL